MTNNSYCSSYFCLRPNDGCQEACALNCAYQSNVDVTAVIIGRPAFYATGGSAPTLTQTARHDAVTRSGKPNADTPETKSTQVLNTYGGQEIGRAHV